MNWKYTDEIVNILPRFLPFMKYPNNTRNLFNSFIFYESGHELCIVRDIQIDERSWDKPPYLFVIVQTGTDKSSVET